MAIIKHKEQRVGVFIDTQNLYHSAKNLYRSRVNFGNVLIDAVKDRALIRALAYVITTESGEEQGFFEALQKFGIETKTKNLQIFMGGAKKADWDVGLAVDAIIMAPKLDAVIIVSGDGDFVPLVQYLQVHEGCQVEVVAFGKSSSGRLIEAADDFIDLCETPQRYLIRNGNQSKGRRASRNKLSPKDKKEFDNEATPTDSQSADNSPEKGNSFDRIERIQHTDE